MSRRRGADGPDGLVVVDKEAGWTSHDVVAKSPRPARHPQGRPLRHPRPRRHRHPAARRGPGHPAAAVPHRRCPRPTRATSCSAPRPPPSTTRGEVTATHDMAGTDLRRRRGRRRGPHRRHHAGAADGLGREGRRQAPPPARPRGHRGRARSPGRSPSTASPSTPTDDPLVVRAEVECSSGTYVRTLAADLGHALGGGAHLRDLRRTAIGSFTLDRGPPAGRDLARGAAHPGRGPARLPAGRGHRGRRRRRGPRQGARAGRPLRRRRSVGRGRRHRSPARRLRSPSGHDREARGRRGSCRGGLRRGAPAAASADAAEAVAPPSSVEADER